VNIFRADTPQTADVVATVPRSVASQLLGQLLPLSLADEVLGVPQPWMKDAACREHCTRDFNPWWPKLGDYKSAQFAKEVCRCCLVVDECLAYALDQGSIEGVWGATTQRERKALARGQRVGDAA